MKKCYFKIENCFCQSITSKQYVITTTAIFIMLLCTKLLLNDPLKRGIIDYSIWFIALSLSLIYLMNNRLSQRDFQISFPFIILFLLQVLGLVQGTSENALIILISTLCAWGIFFSISVSKDVLIAKTFELCLLVIEVVYFLRVINGEQLGNTIPGCLIFVVAIHIIFRHMNIDSKKNKRSIFTKQNKYLFDVIIIIGVLYICITSNARSGILALLLMIVTFIVTTIFPQFLNKRMFYFIVLLWFTLIIFYINIRSFWWYENVNAYSVATFNKNIDSSRSLIWKLSLTNLKWWQWVIGAGTGSLPNIVNYENSSFHSSFIQMIIQNGILGLLCLLLLFKRLWNVFITHADDKVIRMIIASLIGIIVYNNFETTLFQNKAFLGIFQWIILGIGVNRCTKLDRLKYERVCNQLI